MQSKNNTVGDTPRTKLLLVSFGVALGLLLGGGAGFAYKTLRPSSSKLPEGARFEDLNHLRRAMLSRDKRDIKKDRSVSFRSIVSPNPSDEIIYELEPKLAVKFQGVPVRTNSCGMRSPERPVGKADDTYRIALLGDSFAFGWGVEQEKIFAQVMENLLNEFTAGSPKVELLNFGVPGYSTFQQVAQFFETGADFQPDAILVYFVDNDFGPPFFIKNFAKPGRFAKGHQIGAVARKSRGDGEAERRVQNLYRMLDPNAALARLADAVSPQGIPIFVTINPRRASAHDRKRLTILDKRDDVQYIALHEDFLHHLVSNNIDRKRLVLGKDPHPTALMHNILGHLLARPFLPLVAERMEENLR